MMCQSRTAIGPMLTASGRFRFGSNILWHILKVHITELAASIASGPLWHCRNSTPKLYICGLFYSKCKHYNDVIMGAMAYQVTSLTIVYSIVYSGADQRKHQSSASLAFVWGIHRWPMNSPHKGSVTRKMLPFDDVIMYNQIYVNFNSTLPYINPCDLFYNPKYRLSLEIWNNNIYENTNICSCKSGMMHFYLHILDFHVLNGLLKEYFFDYQKLMNGHFYWCLWNCWIRNTNVH